MTELERPKRRLHHRLRKHFWAMTAAGFLLTCLVSSVVAPWLPLADPNATQLSARLLPPSSPGHWLGTDQLGRDVLARSIYGMRLSLAVGAFGVLVSGAIGSLLGLVAGYRSGWLDTLLMRLIDVVLAFPYLLLALAIVATLGPSLWNASLAIALVNVPFFARTVRGGVLAVRQQPYIHAARLSGLQTASVLWREVLPNVLPVIVVAMSTSIGWLILETAGLSFLGLGAQPPTADLGGMLGQSRDLLAIAPHLSVVPGLLIFLIAVAFNLLGDGLRDALDPRPHPALTRVRFPASGSETTRDVSSREATDDASSQVLEVYELSVQFGDLVALDGVSFGVARGARVGLVGESGSGKSVTALTLLGLLPAPGRVTRGSVRLAGKRLEAVSETTWQKIRGRTLAWVPQDPSSALHPLMTIEAQMMELAPDTTRLGRRRWRERCLQLLHEVNLLDPERCLSSYPHELSGGMRQRVALAMAMLHEPALLIADEATTALDVTTQAQVIQLLDRLCRDHQTALLFISHDLALVSQLCDDVLVMHRGSLVESGSRTSVLAQPQAAYTRRLLAAVPRLGEPDRWLSRYVNELSSEELE